MYCDESNLDEKSGDFLLYGGLVINSAAMPDLSSEIANLRVKFKVPRQHKLKFNPCPADISHDEFSKLKAAVIQAAIKFDAASSYMRFFMTSRRPLTRRGETVLILCAITLIASSIASAVLELS
jgi:hypothetical protein